MTAYEALIGLNLIWDIGSVRLAKLLEVFGTPQEIIKADPRHLQQVQGIAEHIAVKISSIKQEAIDQELSWAKKLGLAIVTLYDPLYPKSLKYIPDPPLVLYIRGSLLPQDILAVGMVGSRRPSLYGLHIAEKFGRELAQNNITIVSGMARGIDTAAHCGALSAQGRTIAVIGSGFSHIYPPENKSLSEKISASGAVISELPIKGLPLRQNFPRRNRLISGLSMSVLVVEAIRNSGALITAGFALEQGKDVFAVPGRIDTDAAMGTNLLLQQGAGIVLSVEDILESLPREAKNISRPLIPAAAPKLTTISNAQEGLSCEESKLYTIISSRPVSLDELVIKTGFSMPVITVLLFKLQARKLVRQLAANQFIRSVHGS